jgi:hypothetical protein
MTSEEWARRVVENTLKRTVVLNDDGSAPGMYDLRIGPSDAPEIAIECTGVVDPDFTETWNVGTGEGPLILPSVAIGSCRSNLQLGSSLSGSTLRKF